MGLQLEVSAAFTPPTCVGSVKDHMTLVPYKHHSINDEAMVDQGSYCDCSICSVIIAMLVGKGNGAAPPNYLGFTPPFRQTSD